MKRNITIVVYLIIVSMLVGIVPVVEASDPLPYVYISYPYSVYVGDKATISVEVSNLGDASGEPDFR